MKTILVDAVNTFVNKGEIFKEMHELLDTYPNKKIIVTNANDEQMETFGLNQLPYQVFTLKHDPEKTDPRYFALLCDQLNLSKEDVVYFEHNKDAVASAQSHGIPTLQYDPEKKDLAAVKSFLDEHL